MGQECLEAIVITRDKAGKLTGVYFRGDFNRGRYNCSYKNVMCYSGNPHTSNDLFNNYDKLFSGKGSNSIFYDRTFHYKCVNKFKERKVEEINTEADVPVTEAFELYLRSHFFKIKQNKATKKTLNYWKELFDKNLSPKLKKQNLLNHYRQNRKPKWC